MWTKSASFFVHFCHVGPSSVCGTAEQSSKACFFEQKSCSSGDIIENMATKTPTQKPKTAQKKEAEVSNPFPS
jgi:hypothetical protein